MTTDTTTERDYTEQVDQLTLTVAGQQVSIARWNGQWKIELRGSQADIYTLTADDLDTARAVAVTFGTDLAHLEAMRTDTAQVEAVFAAEVGRYAAERRRAVEARAEQTEEPF